MYFELDDYVKNLGVVWFSCFAGNPLTASTSYITFCLFNVQRNLMPGQEKRAFTNLFLLDLDG
jgi:hypothetical protein